MRFGLHSGQHQVTYPALVGLWRFAAEKGFDACYVFDHFRPLYSDVEAFLPEEASTPDGPCLEGLTALTALARTIPRIGVGMMVAGVGYRSTGYLVHAVTTVAQAAPGRVEIGIGGGWFEPQYRAFGLTLEAPPERLDRLERALEEFTERRDSMRSPPRLWVAGTGERRLIPLAARYADSWNAMYLTPDEFAVKVRVLRAACERAGRDPSAVECSIALRAFCATDAERAHAELVALARHRRTDPGRLAERSLAGDPAACSEQLARYAAAGATHCAVMVHPPYDVEGLTLLTSEVFPAFNGSTGKKPEAAW